jgi:hypothetical protein
VADKETCDSVLQFGDDTLHCELPKDHVTPTEALPQGTPHKTSEHHDNLTGEPWTWWG